MRRGEEVLHRYALAWMRLISYTLLACVCPALPFPSLLCLCGSGSCSSSSRRPLMVPISVLTDSYKASHFLMYPEAELMVAYGQI